LFDVAPQQSLYTPPPPPPPPKAEAPVAVTGEAVAQIKVKTDKEYIRTAAEQFLTQADQRQSRSPDFAGDWRVSPALRITASSPSRQSSRSAKGRTTACGLTRRPTHEARWGWKSSASRIKEVRDKGTNTSTKWGPDVASIKSRTRNSGAAEADRRHRHQAPLKQRRHSAVCEKHKTTRARCARTATCCQATEAQRDMDIRKPATAK